MAIFKTLKEDEQRTKAEEASNLLFRLIQPKQYVGDVYSIEYEFAKVQIHDFHRRQVGGIPSLCFLVATRISQTSENADGGEPNSPFEYQREDSSVILLRVMDATPLPSESEAERVRVETAQKVSGDSTNWDESKNMDPMTHHLLSFAGVKCRVIGTFYVDQSEKHGKLVLRFGSDLSNYYPNQGLKVYKPNGTALATIVNYVDVDRIDETLSNERVRIGDVRYASTNRSFQGVSEVEVKIAPADLIGQKSALFGMTRTGKSNTTKIVIQSVFDLRFAKDKPERIGQLIFDPNGEYANENEQDANNQKNPSAIKNVWRTKHDGREGDQEDVVTYGITEHDNDPRRNLMLLNFFEDDNLQIGKEIIDEALASDNTKFIGNFRQVRFEKPSEQDRSALTRYNRRVLVYRTLLAKAGFDVPPTIKPTTKGLFNKDLIKALEESEEPTFKSVAQALRSKEPSWSLLANAFENLYDFMGADAYKKFDEQYIKNKRGKNPLPNVEQPALLEEVSEEDLSAEGESWADEDLKKLLTMYKFPNGARQIGKVKPQHAARTTTDYAADIYEALAQGRLVIIDQSSGDPLINRSSADRILWYVFKQQQDKFRSGKTPPDMIVYAEEAHTLLPAGSDMDLDNVWVRTAKEGAKYHIGLVYATQEVSSIQRNILKNTANWFIGHLNNTDETKELVKYYDFADFEASIRRAQDRGFLRVKTLSNLFVVPVQVRRFEV